MVYYYQIQAPDTGNRNGNGNGKKWLNTHAPLLRAIFKKQPEIWQPVKSKAHYPVEYADIDKFSKIKNSLNYRHDITAKSYLANLLKDQTDIFPATLIITNRQIVPTSKKAWWLYQKNKAGKYYLKPDDGFAGQGIVILARPQDALNSANATQTPQFRQIRQYSIKKSITLTNRTLPMKFNLSETYVLQQGIQNLHLYSGDRKYEYRIWVLVAWQKSHSPNLKVYFYQDSVMRLTATAYDPRSLKADGNITTSAIYYANKGTYKSDLLSRQDYFDEVFPQAQEIAKYVMELLRPDLEARGSQGFEIFGFDFLNQRYTPKNLSETSSSVSETGPENLSENLPKNSPETQSKLRPVLIEINRHIGYYTYPVGVHAPWVVTANMTMMRDLIDLIMIPMIENQPLVTEKKLWKQVLEF